VTRRELITLLGGVTAWPLAARAQQPAIPVIGFRRSSSLASVMATDGNFHPLWLGGHNITVNLILTSVLGWNE
jgi:hypothetical protein